MRTFDVDFFYTHGKRRNGLHNEDGLVISQYCVAVVDGATAKNASLIEGKTPGEFAKDLLTKAFSQITYAIQPGELVELATSELAKAHELATGIQTESLPAAFRPSASFVAFLPHLSVLVMVGDCQALAGSAYFKFSQVVDGLASQTRANYFHQLLAAGTTLEVLKNKELDDSRKIIAPILLFGASLRNQEGNPLSFSVIDGTPVPMGLVRVIPIDSRVSKLTLATDGYPKLFHSFEKTESYLKALLKQDPLCINELQECKGCLPSQVSFDDRTFLSVALR